MPRYPLGTDHQELERLHLQHRLWSDAAHALWRQAGIRPGARVLDVGAGPGAAAFDLAQLVTSSGAVVAVDESAAFVDYVRREAEERGLAQLRAEVGDVQRLDAVAAVEAGTFQLAYARWVLCFTPHPEQVIAGVARALAPGGALCIHDYFNYAAMTPAPRRPAYTHVVEATARSWRDHGGDPDVVARLPGLLHDAGLELEHLAAHQRIARPGDTMWYWASTWWRSYTPRLVEMGYLTAADQEAFHAELETLTRERDFLVLPPVFELIARRHSGGNRLCVSL
jgi:SAM-dependent methyltransferase